MTTPEELRTLVAEKVMGWENYVHVGSPVWNTECGHVLQAFWNPLESWADAGRVIDRMEEWGWDLSISRYYSGAYCVTFSRAVGAFEGAKADDLKEGISLAALRALGVEVE